MMVLVAQSLKGLGVRLLRRTWIRSSPTDWTFGSAAETLGILPPFFTYWNIYRIIHEIQFKVSCQEIFYILSD